MSLINNKKKYYLVSGASGSIGKQVVKHLLSKGHGVVALTRSLKSHSKKKSGDDIFWVNFDYENNEITLDDKNPFFEILGNKKFSGSFHCAGAYHSGKPLNITISDYSYAIKANLYSAINVVKFSLSTVNQFGSIVVLNSQASSEASENEIAYGTSKRALSAFIDGMQIEATKRKIQLINVLSGAVKSTMVEDRKGYQNFIEASELANLLINLSEAGDSLRIKSIEVLRRNY